MKKENKQTKLQYKKRWWKKENLSKKEKLIILISFDQLRQYKNKTIAQVWSIKIIICLYVEDVKPCNFFAKYTTETYLFPEKGQAGNKHIIFWKKQIILLSF